MGNDLEEDAELLRRIRDALQRHAATVALAVESMEAARAWIAAGFTDAEEVEDWLGARCFDPVCAHALDAAGLTPEQARLRTTEGRTGYEDTIAYKFSRSDLSLEEARRIITSDFWNS